MSQGTEDLRNTAAIEDDWRFAELVVRSILDPELAGRYSADPRSVLAEFGLRTDHRTQTPAIPTGLSAGIRIVPLDRSPVTLAGTGCGVCRSDDDDDAPDTVRTPESSLAPARG
ncbi:hypothetical protein [Streptomyces smaragdinus]|uniref:hypothetical protein n=1 Tax=Streptomyces smaragdinus TaxID=2585196 RepID=UPI0012963806|nr:hypothetical protein [Streptomyces smaragdinus]